MSKATISELPPAIPAATLVLFDETASGPALHLMIERSAAMAFMPGALVFPGGRVEPGDREIARSALVTGVPEDENDAAARVAAIRETLEEVGIATGIRPAPDAALMAAWRQALKQGAAFSALLQHAGRHLGLSALLPYAHWLPKLPAPRRFETRFYLARHEGGHAAAHDEDEATRHVWLSAAEALEGGRTGRHTLMFPTMANLARLATHPRFALAAAHLASTPVRLISPSLSEENGVRVLRISEGCGYPLTAHPIRGEVR